MEEMQKQIETFVSSLNTEITQRQRPVEQEQSQTTLMPIIDVKRTKKA
jgi:hypothetical protein